MPDPQLDDSIGHLQAFIGTLAAQTPDLAKAADDLSTHGHQLEVAQHELRAELAVASANLDTLESEAATYGGAVESEAESLSSTAFDDVDTAMTAVDGAARELQESVASGMAVRASGLEHYPEELVERGFSPLRQTMSALARGAFGNWAAVAEASLGKLDQRVDLITTELQKDEITLSDDRMWMVKYHDASTWVAEEMRANNIHGGIPLQVSAAPLAGELASRQESLRSEAQAATSALRTQLAEAARETGEQIAQRALALVDGIGTALDGCELAEHGVGEAEEEGSAAVPRTATLAALFDEIEAADGELQHIQTVLQAMDAP